MLFRDKAIIVTGATSGIGRATAASFGREAASLVLVGRDEAALAEVAGVVRAAGGRAVSCAADVTAGDAPRQIIAAALDAFGGVDVLVNAAGAIATGALDATTDEVWDAMMAVNLRAPFRLIHRFGKRSGHTANIGYSVRVQRASPEFRSVPRHIRVVPSHPCQACAIRADAWCGIEVVTGSNDPGLGRTV